MTLICGATDSCPLPMLAILVDLTPDPNWHAPAGVRNLQYNSRSMSTAAVVVITVIAPVLFILSHDQLFVSSQRFQFCVTEGYASIERPSRFLSPPRNTGRCTPRPSARSVPPMRKQGGTVQCIASGSTNRPQKRETLFILSGEFPSPPT
jgi:hypothetical protein